MNEKDFEDLSAEELTQAIQHTLQHVEHLSHTDPDALRELLDDMQQSAQTDPNWEAKVARARRAMDAIETAAPEQFRRDSTWFRSHIEDAMAGEETKTYQ